MDFNSPKRQGRPKKIGQDALTTAISRYAGQKTGQATAPDAEIAAAVAEELGMEVSPNTVRRTREEMGISPFPRGGARPGAGRKPGQSKLHRPAQARKLRPVRKLTCSREGMVRWNAQEYSWSSPRGRYVYTGDGARPRDLPGSLPAWGAGNGLL